MSPAFNGSKLILYARHRIVWIRPQFRRPASHAFIRSLDLDEVTLSLFRHPVFALAEGDVHGLHLGIFLDTEHSGLASQT